MSKGLLASLTAVGVAIVVASCDNGAVPEPSRPLHVDRADSDLVGRWNDRDGRPLGDGSNAMNGILAINTRAGSTTCDEDHVTVFLTLAWPIGRSLDTNKGITSEEAPRYVRDTSDRELHFAGESDIDVVLPPSARATGFFLNGNTIHVEPGGRAIFVSRSDQTVERWPRLQDGPDGPVCAD